MSLLRNRHEVGECIIYAFFPRHCRLMGSKSGVHEAKEVKWGFTCHQVAHLENYLWGETDVLINGRKYLLDNILCILRHTIELADALRDVDSYIDKDS